MDLHINKRKIKISLNCNYLYDKVLVSTKLITMTGLADTITTNEKMLTCSDTYHLNKLPQEQIMCFIYKLPGLSQHCVLEPENKWKHKESIAHVHFKHTQIESSCSERHISLSWFIRAVEH